MKKPIPDDITIVLTSCGRWDLLIQSIDTFLAHHTPGRFILVEDSADRDFADRLAKRYPDINIILNDPRLGQHKAIDRAYALVTTPLVLHLEDDWLFSGAADLDSARSVLAADTSVVAVCFSVFRRLKRRHRIFGKKIIRAGSAYCDMRPAHRDWYGYSFYPTLLRRSTWQEHGPYAGFQNERAISRHMKEHGLGILHQLPGVGLHVGRGRSVFDPARVRERRRVSGAFRRRLAGRDRFEPNRG